MKSLDFSIKIPFWKIIHFKSGKKVGESKASCFKGLVHFDCAGRVVGKSLRNFIGELNHYDYHDRCTGYSRQSNFSEIIHFNNRGMAMVKTYSVLGILLIHADIVCYNGKKGGR